MVRKFIIVLGALMLVNFMVTGIFAQKKGNKRKTETPEVVITQPVGPPTVAKVINGDLLQLTNGELVRLMGADTPVMPINGKVGQEPWASQARNFTDQLTIGKELVINGLGLTSDEYGRRIGLVYIGELWLDYELVKEGFAVVQNNRYLDNKSKQLLLDAQSEALTFKRGIWQADNQLPLPPREFRAANGLSESDKPKDESWKNVITKASNRGIKNNNNPSPSDGNSPSTTNSSTSNLNLTVAIELLEALKQLQEKLNNNGISTSELTRLVAVADEKAQIMGNKIDAILNKNLREGLDAYKLVLDAFKKRDVANDEERARLTKFISRALEIADQTIIESEKRLAKVNK
ncbi:MAG: nuclease [bacterium]|nr:MAG: nuclease [bacterium]